MDVCGDVLRSVENVWIGGECVDRWICVEIVTEMRSMVEMCGGKMEMCGG